MNLTQWQPKFIAFLETQLGEADAAHDLTHVRRVVANAHKLAEAEGAKLEVVLPAAWLHDCVSVAKDSPLRKQASRLAGEKAAVYLQQINYPLQYIPDIQHAIEAHSFSANITPRTLEAQVVQDADRLDSLGAIGIARCLLTGVAMGTALYHSDEPFGKNGRPLNDKQYSIDHFYIKLFKLVDKMNTAQGKAEAQKRTEYMRGFLAQLGHEIT